MKRLGSAFLLAGVSAFATMAAVTEADAGFITANAWVTTEANSLVAAPATLGASDCHQPAGGACTAANADVTFTINGLDFDSRRNGSSDIGGFLSSNPNPTTGLAFHNGVTAATLMDPTIWEFTGTASFTNNETFTFQHDDGVTMIVDGNTVVSAIGPTSPETTTATYTGPTGNFSFEIVYAECCGPPAVLETTLVGPLVPAPEPASLALLGSGLAGLGAVMVRRRRSKRS